MFLVFLVLKLTGHIDWSWLWVTAPLWGPLAVVFAIAAVLGLVWAICATVAAIWVAVEKRLGRG